MRPRSGNSNRIPIQNPECTLVTYNEDRNHDHVDDSLQVDVTPHVDVTLQLEWHNNQTASHKLVEWLDRYTSGQRCSDCKRNHVAADRTEDI